MFTRIMNAECLTGPCMRAVGAACRPISIGFLGDPIAELTKAIQCFGAVGLLSWESGRGIFSDGSAFSIRW